MPLDPLLRLAGTYFYFEILNFEFTGTFLKKIVCFSFYKSAHVSPSA